MNEQMTGRRRAVAVAGAATALMLLVIPGAASADPVPIGNGEFTRAGAPVFRAPVPGAPAILVNDRAGSAVSIVCTGGWYVQLEGYYDRGDGENVVTAYANSGDVKARTAIDSC